MAKRYGVNDITKLPAKPIFFDSNIIIYIFWPTGNIKYAADYSTIFKNLIKEKREMVLDITVISEVVNRTIKIEYEIFCRNSNKSKNYSFKKYRDSQDGKTSIQLIYNIFRRNIIPNFNIIGQLYNRMDIEAMLTINSLDFSDKIILNIIKTHNCILLTNDKDFATSDIDILSSNPTLLKV